MWQKTLFVNYYTHLCDTGAFQAALDQLAGETTPLREMFEMTLLVNTAFHRMLLAREYSFLFEKCPDNAGELIVEVGGGAVKTVRECARKDFVKGRDYHEDELLADLRALHAVLLAELDEEVVKAVCPKGWMLDHSEHACCERRSGNFIAGAYNFWAGAFTLRHPWERKTILKLCRITPEGVATKTLS